MSTEGFATGEGGGRVELIQDFKKSLGIRGAVEQLQSDVGHLPCGNFAVFKFTGFFSTCLAAGGWQPTKNGFNSTCSSPLNPKSLKTLNPKPDVDPS